MKGKLYVVSTPIGNLKDITLRAIDVLKEVDLIAAEDTRRSRTLLREYGIRNSLVSYHDRNKRSQSTRLLNAMKKGKDCALISDSGTPGIQDPGYFLVRLAVDEGIVVVPIPGASAVLAAAVVSGLPVDRFAFEGYLPRRRGRRKKRLETLAGETRTMIFYESPHRLVDTLEDILDLLGDRNSVLARELTKKFEELLRGRISEILTLCRERRVRGEYVIVVGGEDGVQ
jgi:16S rRNA (cytidine1402-2'-O)-methyltransferase